MWIILSLFVIGAIFAYLIETTEDSHTRNVYIFICFTIFTLVSGTRLVGGSDFEIYEGLYNNTETFPDILDPNNRNNRYEVGYLYISAFFKTLGFSFYGFCLIHSMIFYFCLWKGLKEYTTHFGIVILVLMYKLMFYDTMISMRQSLTIAFFFLILPFMTRKEWLKYYVCAFLISQIHNGALLLLLLYPLIYIPLSKNKIIFLNLVFLPTIFIGFMGIDVLGPIGKFLEDNAANEAMEQRSGYFDNENENLSPIGIFHTLEYYLMMVLLLINIHKISLNNRKVATSIWMFLCLLPLFTLLRGSEILTREKDYFVIFYAVILGYLVDKLPNYRRLLYVGVLLVCAFGYYRFVILFDNGGFLKYKSWLFEPGYSIFLN